MSQDFETPPMGGDNLPVKELKPQTAEVKSNVVVQPVVVHKKNNKQLILIGLIVVIALTLGLYLGTTINKEKKIEVLPSPSPIESTPLSKPSQEPQNLQEKLDNLQTKIDNVDFKEQNLLPPMVDYKLRFQLKE